MINIPPWLRQDIKKNQYPCPTCSKIITEEGIIGIGIRISSKFKDKTVFFFEFLCTCKNKVLVELNVMTIDDFVSNMIEAYEGVDKENIEHIDPINSDDESVFKNRSDHSSRISSLISDKEFAEMVEGLNECEYWDDFLIKLGFSSQEIEQHKEVGVKEFNKRKNGV